MRIGFLQFIGASSNPSIQSTIPSQIDFSGMHSPPEHLKLGERQSGREERLVNSTILTSIILL